MSDDDRGSGCDPDQGNSSKRQKTTPDASPAALLSHVISPGAKRGASRGASRGANGGTSRGLTRGANQGASRGAGGLANRGVRIRGGGRGHGGGRGTSKRAESQLASQSAKNKADENLGTKKSFSSKNRHTQRGLFSFIAQRGSFQPPPQFIVPQTANGQFLSLQNMSQSALLRQQHGQNFIFGNSSIPTSSIQRSESAISPIANIRQIMPQSQAPSSITSPTSKSSQPMIPAFPHQQPTNVIASTSSNLQPSMMPCPQGPQGATTVINIRGRDGEYIPIPLIPSIQRPNNFVALRNLPAATSENFAPSSLSPDLNNRVADHSEVSTGLLNTPSSDTSAIPSYPVATMTSEVFIDSVPPLNSQDDLNQSHVGAQSQNGSEIDPLGSNQENLHDCHVNSDGIGTIAVSEEEVIDSDQQINSEITDEDSVAETKIISSEKDDKEDERSIFELPSVSGLQGPSGMTVRSNIQQPLSVQPASNIQSVSGTDIHEMKATLQAILNGVAENTRRIARLEEVAFDQPSGQVGVAPVEKPKKSLLPALPVRKKHHLREQLSQALENSVEMQEQFRDFILKIGGKDPKDRIRKAMKKVMTDRIGRRYNWTGAKGGKNFGNLAVATILTNIFVSGGVADEYTVQSTIGDWLRRAGTRYNSSLIAHPNLENETSGESSDEEGGDEGNDDAIANMNGLDGAEGNHDDDLPDEQDEDFFNDQNLDNDEENQGQ
ncbi:hypothetical protein QAD02_016790 [Eretmocerus hayati]|uniref:Uncharacterized protein n=1 Tax=Eretmocerus hayati TaxID=131215 RepID=A0ACC2PD42_9HYME|nr:hypothetical protein QAD02_016790 [Eretmocerus hayati]